jgi:hypothetical protein
MIEDITVKKNVAFSLIESEKGSFLIRKTGVVLEDENQSGIGQTLYYV